MALITDIASTQWTYDTNSPGKIVQGLESIKQCVFLILTTQKGSDPLRPDFGCGVYEYVDAPPTFATPRMIKEIAAALSKYEPRIEQVKVVPLLDGSQASFTVSYKIINTKSTDQLNITYGNTTAS